MLKNAGAMLRQLLNGDEIVLMPGVYDGISARVAQQAGFNAMYLTGAGVSASHIGEADIGLTTMTDMLDSARAIMQKAQVPLVCDCDTGYGNALNIIRTVHEFEMAGAAAVQFEDQISPKRCGHLDGKQCIEPSVFAKRISAAVNERYYSDTLIIARTDSRAVYEFDKALDRAKLYMDSGADIIFFEAPQSLEEIEKIGRELGHQIPLIINQVIGGKTPSITAEEAKQLGYKIIIFPDALPYGASVFLREICDRIMTDRQSRNSIPGKHDSRDLFLTMGMSEWRELEEKYKNL